MQVSTQGLGAFRSGLGGQQAALGQTQEGILGSNIGRLGSLGAINQAQAQAEADATREANRQAAMLPQENLARFGAQVTGLMGGYPGTTTQTFAPNPTPLQTALRYWNNTCRFIFRKKIMNRVLKRPMFRMGGSTGTGITSGLDRPGYKEGTPDRVTQGLDPFIRDVKSTYARSGAMPKQSPLAAGTLPGFLTQFGLDLVSRTPTGNIFQTAAMSAQEPFKQFQAGVAQRGDTRAALNRDIIGKAINLKTTADAADASMKKTQMLIDADIAALDQEHANEIEKINLEAQLGTGDATTYAKKQAADSYKATFSPELERLNGLIDDTEDPDLRSQYQTEKTGLLNKIIRGQQAIYLGQQTDVEFSREIITIC